MDLKQHIRHVPDFPKAGILFYDITTLLQHPQGFEATIDRAVGARMRTRASTTVVGIESRGFILGGAVAHRLGAGFVPVRKPGKLPAKALKETYALEYGTDSLEVHEDAVGTASGSSSWTTCWRRAARRPRSRQLVQRLGGDLARLAFLIELLFLDGRARLGGQDVFSVWYWLAPGGSARGRARRVPKAGFKLWFGYNDTDVPVAQLDRASAS